MDKVNVELRDGTPMDLDVPEGVERSCFGAIRLFPRIPRAISRDELEWIRRKRPSVAARLIVTPYVESTRRDIRGVSERELEDLSKREGVAHLHQRRQLEVLRERGKVKDPEQRRVKVVSSSETVKSDEEKSPKGTKAFKASKASK